MSSLIQIAWKGVRNHSSLVENKKFYALSVKLSKLGIEGAVYIRSRGKERGVCVYKLEVVIGISFFLNNYEKEQSHVISITEYRKGLCGNIIGLLFRSMAPNFYKNHYI